MQNPSQPSVEFSTVTPPAGHNLVENPGSRISLGTRSSIAVVGALDRSFLILAGPGRSDDHPGSSSLTRVWRKRLVRLPARSWFESAVVRGEWPVTSWEQACVIGRRGGTWCHEAAHNRTQGCPRSERRRKQRSPPRRCMRHEHRSRRRPDNEGAARCTPLNDAQRRQRRYFNSRRL